MENPMGFSKTTIYKHRVDQDIISKRLRLVFSGILYGHRDGTDLLIFIGGTDSIWPSFQGYVPGNIATKYG